LQFLQAIVCINKWYVAKVIEVQSHRGGVCGLRAKRAPGNVQIHRALDHLGVSSAECFRPGGTGFHSGLRAF